MVWIANHDMVKNLDLQKLPSSNEVTGDFNVGFGWCRFTARMIVLCAAPSYVQLPAVGIHADAGCKGKGALCLSSHPPIRVRKFAD